MKGLLVAALIGAGLQLQAQSGLLLPRDSDQPNPAVLSLEEMNVDITIDDGDARVYVTQIFTNHTPRIEEGTYIFALPTGSTVSDFATWDGPVRTPAVILERKRAEEVYEEARRQAIDPGLLESGERTGADAKADSTFTAKITPIPPYGTKRLELEYHQQLKASDFAQSFVFPFTAAEYQRQSAAHLRIRFSMHSSSPLTNFAVPSKSYPLRLSRQDAHSVIGEWDGDSVAFTEDLHADWRLDARAADSLVVSAFRNPHPRLPSPADSAPRSQQAEPGFFLAQSLIGMPAASVAATVQSRHLVLLLDTSLSMQWDKLERSYGALETVLLGLKSTDDFSLLLFNQDVTSFRPQPTSATPDAVQQALAFVKFSRLRGGTDLAKALTAGLAQVKSTNASLYLFTDGNSDRGDTVLTRKIAATYARQWRASPHPRTNIFAVGDDANLPLLQLLAKNDGLLENVLSTEPLQPKLGIFLGHSSSRPVGGLRLDIAPTAAIHTVYPMDPAVYTGSIAAWVGDYISPARGVGFTVTGRRGETPLRATAAADLPAEELDHPQLPRLWAQARVNALLQQIASDGETRAAVDEIIELSRRYKFVTPYTSFLAVPRSLLRPRVIRPGDPILRVHTDPSITSVVALFPFGLTKPLRHLASEDVTQGPDADRLYETRFIAPADMQDGTYAVRLILRDVRGNTYSERKTFVIASTAPSVRVTLNRTRFRRGEVMLIKAGATSTTRTLTARLEGAVPVDLRWNSAAGASTGEMLVPETLAPGVYTLSVTAEDVAHNVGSQEVRIEVVP